MCTCKSHDTLVEEDSLQKLVVSFRYVIPRIELRLSCFLANTFICWVISLVFFYMLLKSVFKSGDIAQFDILAWRVRPEFQITTLISSAARNNSPLPPFIL